MVSGAGMLDGHLPAPAACNNASGDIMKLIVLGGAGDMGSRTVEDLVSTPGVDLVTIADRNVDGARAWQQKLAGKGARVEVRAVDAKNHGDLVQAIAGHDAAASALGPFYLFEPRMAKAAIEARVPYASICDDWIAWLQVHADYDGAARQAGVPILSGFGASPGLTNLMALQTARGMDYVRRIDVSCYQPWNAGGGEAVLRHLLFIVTGEIGAWRDGKETRVKACTLKHEVEVPQYGKRVLYNLGHPEPVTLPRHFKGMEECNFWMGFGTGMGILAKLGRDGWFEGEKRVDRALHMIAPFERWLSPEVPGNSALRIDVWGTQDGQEVHRMACGTGAMRDGTAIPLAVGTVLLASKKLNVPGGVHGAEICDDAKLFIPLLREKGIMGYTDLAMTQVLV
jgi:saccharopine dehydrogenase-like NADP-dependent oxidoreductase